MTDVIKFFSSEMQQAIPLKGNATSLSKILDQFLVSGSAAVNPVSAVVVDKKLRFTLPNANKNFSLYSTVEISGSGIDAKFHGEHKVIAVSGAWFEIATDEGNGTLPITPDQTSIKYASLGWSKKELSDPKRVAYLPAGSTQVGVSVDKETTEACLKVKGFGRLKNVASAYTPELESSDTYFNGTIPDATKLVKYMLVGNNKFFYFISFYKENNDGPAALMAYGKVSDKAYVLAAHSDKNRATTGETGYYWPTHALGAFDGHDNSYKDLYLFEEGSSLTYTDCYHTSRAPMCLQNPYSAATNYPNNQGKIELSKVEVIDSQYLVKGQMPGLYYIQTECYGYFEHGGIVQGTGDLAGKHFLSIYINASSNYYFSIYNTINGGNVRYANVLIDLTGPWE